MSMENEDMEKKSKLRFVILFFMLISLITSAFLIYEKVLPLRYYILFFYFFSHLPEYIIVLLGDFIFLLIFSIWDGNNWMFCLIPVSSPLSIIVSL